MMRFLAGYEAKRAISVSLALMLAMIAGNMINAQQVFWAGMTALLVSQTSRGTPARQSFHMLFMILVFVIAATWMMQYVSMQLELMIITAVMFFICSVVVMVHQPENFRFSLMWLIPPMVFLMATLWPQPEGAKIIDRVIQVLVGGGIGMFASMLVLPVVPYREFSKGLLPIIDAMLAYSRELHASLIDHKSHKQALDQCIRHIETIMLSQQNQYPEWVFETGFNRNLRSGFRYVLLQLEYISEGFISLDYHLRKPVDADLIKEVSPALAKVVEKNEHLLQVLRDYFSKGQFEDKHENFTSDITDMQNVMHTVLPGSIELLDMSQDYVNLSAIVRDVIDIRELLVKLIAGLPVS